MSGKKTSIVSLSPEDCQAFHKDLMNRLFSFEDKPAPDLTIEMDFQNYLSRANEQIKNREDDFHDSMLNYNQQLADVEAQTSDKLIESQQKIMEQLSLQTSAVEENIIGFLDAQMDLFNQQVLESHHQQQNQLMRMRRQIVSQQQANQDKAQTAENWIQNAHQLLLFINAHYNHEKFTPNKLAFLDDDLQLAVQNFDMGLFEAALVTGQNIYRQASELRIILEREESQWNTCFMLACKKIEILKKELREKQNVIYKPDGSQNGYDFDVNFWSDNHWAELAGEVEKYRLQLDNQPDLVGIQDLRSWLSHDLPCFDNKIASIKKEAVDNLVNSQIRTNIADLIMQGLQSQGYSLDQAMFLQDDSRNGFIFTANSRSGNAIRVMVNPGPQEKNEIQLEAIDARPQTEHFLKRRAFEISKSLQNFGLKVDQFVQKSQSAAQPSNSEVLALAEQKGQYVLH